MVEWGLFGLFFSAFVAGSLLAFPSEVVFVALLEAGADPVLAVVVGGLGNTLGGLTLYGIGVLIARGGRLSERLSARFPPESEATQRWRARLDRFGPPALVFAWVPVVGDALPLAAGLSRLPLVASLLWLCAGKVGRYAAIALLHAQAS